VYTDKRALVDAYPISLGTANAAALVRQARESAHTVPAVGMKQVHA
jgi:hypothetical protein